MSNPEIVTLREYIAHIYEEINRRFENLKKDLSAYIDVRFKAAQEAVDKAERTMNARLEVMNGLKEQLDRQAALFVTREELIRIFERTELDIATLQERVAHFITRDELERTLDSINKAIRLLEKDRDILLGRASQTSVLITQLFTGAALITSVVAVVLNILKP